MVKSFNGKDIELRYLNTLGGPLSGMDTTTLRIFLIASSLQLVKHYSVLGEGIGGKPDGMSELRNCIAHSKEIRITARGYQV